MNDRFNSSLSDSQLVNLYKQEGKRLALEVLYRRHEKDIFNFCLKLTGDMQDAEDLSQDAYLKAIDSIRNSSSDKICFISLVKRISNRIYKPDSLKNNKNKKEPETFDPELEVCFIQKRKNEYADNYCIPDSDGDCQEMQEWHEWTQSLISRIGRPLLEKVLELSILEGLSDKEISIKLNLKLSTVECRRRRGMFFFQRKKRRALRLVG